MQRPAGDTSAPWRGTPVATPGCAAFVPWFDYYAGDVEAVAGATALKGLASVAEMGEQKGETPLPENEAPTVPHVVGLIANGTSRVREFAG